MTDTKKPPTLSSGGNMPGFFEGCLVIFHLASFLFRTFSYSHRRLRVNVAHLARRRVDQVDKFLADKHLGFNTEELRPLEHKGSA